MKYIIKTVFIIIAFTIASSCVDDKPAIIKIIPEEPRDPDDPKQPFTINSYNDLKTYVDRAANPVFKLGVGVLLGDYVAKGAIYNLLTANFDQITLGNEMKQDAVVQADGNLKLDNIVKLMQVAKEAGVSVYGHTLVWHSQQRASYLNSLIVPVLTVGNTGTPLDPNLIANSGFETDGSGWACWGDNKPTRSISKNGEGFGGGYALILTNPTASSAWYAQLAYDLPDPLANSAKYILNLNVKASKFGAISADMQDPTDYKVKGSFGLIGLTTDWSEVTLETTIDGQNAKRFIFNCGNFDGTIYFDNVTISRVNPNNTNATRFVQLAEKTAEEKNKIITAEMERWIKGILEVTQDIKNWDVVNEPMDDGRPFELKTAPKDPAANQFYWQDYMGKDFAVKAVQFARQYGPPDIKLFINDYNLEYNLNKCRGIIEYVKYVESKGVTVDGIGTQMHISLNTNKNNIVEMYKLLAASGKLIKITELDIGLTDEKGVVVYTPDATAALYQEQAEMYRFVVEKYFEHIPAAQRYGITVWSPFDSPAESGWRSNQPIGLWTINHARKQAYGGFANGLAGRDVSADK